MTAYRLDFPELLDKFQEDSLGLKFKVIQLESLELSNRAFQNQLSSPVEGLYLITEAVKSQLQTYFKKSLKNPKTNLLITSHRNNFRDSGHGYWMIETIRSKSCYYKNNWHQLIVRDDLFCLAGGAPLAEIIGLAPNDYDLFILNPEELSDEDLKNRVYNYASSCLEDETLQYLIVSDHALTLGRKQFVFRSYTSLTQILQGFDISVCGVGYYGNQLYMTPKALYGIINRRVDVRPEYSSYSYFPRLLKYLKKGFDLVFPNLINYCHAYHEDLLALSDAIREHMQEVDNYQSSQDKAIRLRHQVQSQDLNFDYNSLRESLLQPSVIDRLFYELNYYGLIMFFDLKLEYGDKIEYEDYYCWNGTTGHITRDRTYDENYIREALKSVKFLRIDSFIQAHQSISFFPDQTKPEDWYGRYATIKTASSTKSATKMA